MEQFAILAMLEAKPGKEPDVEEFLKKAIEMVRAKVPGAHHLDR